jgi:CRISPR-associated protein Cmr2
VSSSALLTFSIGPVHAFIGQARRIADLWAGSQILSDLTRVAVDALSDDERAELIFPKMTRGEIPQGLPNRFVARVPTGAATNTAQRIEGKVRQQWQEIVEHGIAQLQRLGFDTRNLIENDPLWREAIHCAWSWVSEDGPYQRDSRAGAELYAASRVFRPFSQSGESGMKCAICGERNALPNGERATVTKAWQRAEELAKERLKQFTPFVRAGQTRLCLVCASKRFYPTFEKIKNRGAIFGSFESFQPDDDRSYFALVSMDGDRLGEALGEASEEAQGEISAALSKFAGDLRTADSAALNLNNLGLTLPPRSGQTPKTSPQLIYAGGEDVLFVADPRDALPCARAIRDHYGDCFEARKFDRARYTISGAVIFAHTKIPAGRLLIDAEELLKRRAKAHRNAVAVALHKRSGPAVETVFPWDGKVHVGLLKELVDELEARNLASRQTYDLGEESRVLTEVFSGDAQWQAWLEWRLARGGASREHVGRLAGLLAPLFNAAEPRIEALRIARFLAVEVASKQIPVAEMASRGKA